MVRMKKRSKMNKIDSYHKSKATKKETREQFLKRLQKTARSIPAKTIKKAIGNMATRCTRLFKAKGGLFEEGK